MWLDEDDWYVDKPLYKKIVWSENKTAVCVIKHINKHTYDGHNLFWMPKYKGDNEFAGTTSREYNNKIGLYDDSMRIEVD